MHVYNLVQDNSIHSEEHADVVVMQLQTEKVCGISYAKTEE